MNNSFYPVSNAFWTTSLTPTSFLNKDQNLVKGVGELVNFGVPESTSMKKLTLFPILLLLVLPILAQWEIQDHFPEGTYLNDVYFVNDTIGWVVGFEGTIFKTTNAGQSWMDQSVRSANLIFYDVFFVDRDNGWIAGYFYVDLGGYWGVIYHTSDGGENWNEQLHEGGYGAIFGIFFTDTLNGVAVDSGWPGILKTNNGGDEWNVYPSNWYSLNSVFFINDTLGWIGGWESIKYTNDGGENWYIQSTLPNIDIKDVHFTDVNKGWAVGEILNNETGIFYKTINGGNAWNETEVFDNPLNGVFFVNSNYGWTVGDNGYIGYTIDGGDTWYNQSVDSSRLASINITSNYQGWITGGGLYHADLSNIVGIDENANQYSNNGFICPNPASSFVTLSNPNATLQLHTLQGQLILTSSLGETQISLEGVTPGVYVATIREGEMLIGREKLVVR